MRNRIAIVLCAAALCLGAARADTRVALVIGNSTYRNVAPLANPENDARQVAAALRRVGFSTVEVRSNLGSTDMRNALQAFTRQAEHADVAVVYYAGHGMEVGGSNYLIPVDAELARQTDLNFEAIPLAMVLDAVSGARRLKIVVLDACRNNPFAGHMKGAGTRAIGRGLARIEPESNDTLVAYAAKDGTTADDGTGGNSPFATAFAKEIATPGLEVRLLFGKVRDDVYRATNKKQEPFVYGSLGGDAFYFVAPAGSSATVMVTPSAPATDPKAIELAFWQSVAASEDIASLQSYLDKYPKGEFAGLARARIKALKKPAPAVATVASVAPPPARRPPSATDTRAEEMALWNAVADSDDAAALQSYLDRYPYGTFANAARAKIATLRKYGAQAGRHSLGVDTKAVQVAYKMQGKIQNAAQRAEEAAAKGREEAAKDRKPTTGTSNGASWQYSGGSRVLGIGSHDGVVTWSDGTRYEGDWHDGKRAGYGVCSYADGTRYAGEWRDDRRTGLGVETDADGTHVQGEWREDKLHGYAARYDARGNVVEAAVYDFGVPRAGGRRR